SRTNRLLRVGMVQENEHSCSVASIAMLVNAARSLWDPLSIDELISQRQLLETVGNPSWQAAVGPGGDGVELDGMAALIGQSLRAYGLSRFEIEIVHVDRITSGIRSKARRELIETAHSPSRFIIANFLQGIYTKDAAATVGHYAPVGAFDSLGRGALIFDPDPRGYHPYWVNADRFLEGMATRDDSCGLSRGYVSVRLEH
ncbi:MAG TPA: phytochelatin synthase family protein, partial [Planctomycetaceae bacterium]